MKNYIVVRRITMMIVVVPVRSVGMYLYISRPNGVANSYPCIEKVRACICVVHTGSEYLQGLSVFTTQFTPCKVLVFPYIMKEVLVHGKKFPLNYSFFLKYQSHFGGNSLCFSSGRFRKIFITPRIYYRS